ncbi:sensor domain-containing diguanylate cyclase [Kangiella koreensis]|uniref:diguanylate cyclase n=1 Tax=Kangiella koreensis (strain DSM 16069 / JCM 12317 / KCTC 12182 / SW-125) TaxID=523791 RepID=C7RC10_KANKD|nr:diguanylate cyclase [Kangiella koreensis]ACV26802.1 diguanylate cyclase [Kangiella koreensis DSM 16069]
MLIRSYLTQIHQKGRKEFGVGKRSTSLYSFLFLLLSALAYYVSARFGMSLFTLFPSNISLLWLPSGIGFLMCLHWGWKAVPLIIIAAYYANLPGMDISTVTNPKLHTLVSALADGAESFIAMLLFSNYLPKGVINAKSLSKFIWWVCIIPPVITAIIITSNLWVGGYLASHQLEMFFISILLANSLGMLMVYQVYNSLKLDPIQFKKPSINLCLSIALVGLIFVLGTWRYPAIIYLILPVLVIMSFELRLLTVASISTLAFIGLISATHFNLGPFVSLTDQATAFELMAFTFACAITVFGLALQQYQMRLAKESGERWKLAAEHDVLTGLPNRRAFMPALTKEHHRSVRLGHNYCVIIWDIDDFKRINDSYGHDFGDRVLVRLAQIMRISCRDIDYYARIGGEEFAVLLPETDRESGEKAMERFRQEVADETFAAPDGTIHSVTISIGLASLDARVVDESELLAEADKALYQSKAQGKNQTNSYEH